jgi:hypothetical protein
MKWQEMRERTPRYGGAHIFKKESTTRYGRALKLERERTPRCEKTCTEKDFVVLRQEITTRDERITQERTSRYERPAHTKWIMPVRKDAVIEKAPTRMDFEVWRIDVRRNHNRKSLHDREPTQEISLWREGFTLYLKGLSNMKGPIMWKEVNRKPRKNENRSLKESKMSSAVKKNLR